MPNSKGDGRGQVIACAGNIANFVTKLTFGSRLPVSSGLALQLHALPACIMGVARGGGASKPNPQRMG